MTRLLTLFLAAVVSAVCMFVPAASPQAAVVVDSGKALGASGVSVLDRSGVAVSAPADTNEDVLATIVIPAGAMGPNGRVRITTEWSFTNNANSKGLNVRFGGAAGTLYANVGVTTQQNGKLIVEIENRGSAALQRGSESRLLAGGVVAYLVNTSSVDTTQSTSVVISGQKTVSGDTLTLESYLVELIPGS